MRVKFDQDTDTPIFIKHESFVKDEETGEIRDEGMGLAFLSSINGDRATLKFINSEITTKYVFSELNVNGKNSPWKMEVDDPGFILYKQMEDRAKKQKASYSDGNKVSIGYKSTFNFSGYMKDYKGPIQRRQYIRFNSDEERAETLAFLAAYKPEIRATVYEQCRDDFEAQFPGQNYILDPDNTNTPYPYPHFDFYLSKKPEVRALMPEILIENINEKSNKVCRTGTIEDMVMNCGFNFGNDQNYQEIHKAMKNQPCTEIFEAKYEEFKQQLDLLREKGILKQNSYESNTADEIDTNLDR